MRRPQWMKPEPTPSFRRQWVKWDRLGILVSELCDSQDTTNSERFKLQAHIKRLLIYVSNKCGLSRSSCLFAIIMGKNIFYGKIAFHTPKGMIMCPLGTVQWCQVGSFNQFSTISGWIFDRAFQINSRLHQKPLNHLRTQFIKKSFSNLSIYLMWIQRNCIATEN